MKSSLFEALLALTPPELHFVYMALMTTSAVLTVGATAALAVRRSHGGPITRGLAMVACGLNLAAAILAIDLVGLHIYGPLTDTLRIFALCAVGTVGGASILVAATAASARTALIMAASSAMGGLGLLIYLLLMASVPPGIDPSWELSRFFEFGTFLASGFMLLLGVGVISARRQGVALIVASSLCGALGLATLSQGMANHPSPGLSFILPAWLPVVGTAVWMVGLWLQRPGKKSGALTRAGGLFRRLDTRLLEHPAMAGAVVALPVMAAMAAVVLAGSGSAREASRVSVGGLSVTPQLAVPFLFAVALGVVVARDQWRWRDAAGIGLTVAMTGLLLAQKEVGNTAVVLMVASAVLLVARGTLPHLIGGAGLGAAALAVAYQLAPIISAIPFTVRERVHLWLGGAELLQRGGHLVTASYVGFKVGGFWGLGIHNSPDLNLPRLVIALHTDFPLVVLGLFGGWGMLALYIAFFTALAVLLLHTFRTLNFSGDTRRARFQTPILVGLWAVPVISTTLNLAGAISQVTPFTGVPVLFISTSSIFVIFNFGILALFLLAGNRDALRARLKTKEEAALKEAADPNANPINPRKNAPSNPAPDSKTATQEPPAVKRGPLRRWWRRWTTPATWSMAIVGIRRTMRLRQVDQGAVILMLLMPIAAIIFTVTIHKRYTDDARYFGHPRLTQKLHIEPGEGGTWAITQAPDEALLGPLSTERLVELDGVLMGFRQGRLQVRGACFDEDKLQGPGVALGFAGMLDAPELPYVDQITRPAVGRLTQSGQPQEEISNDIVLPFGDIATHHVRLRRLESGRYHLRPLVEHAPFFVMDKDGRRVSGKASMFDPGEGFGIGSVRPRRFFVTEEPQGRVCVAMRKGALFEYPLSYSGPTVVGSMALLRRQLAIRTTDLTFAQDLKAAAEAGLLTSKGPQGPLVVVPHDKKTREGWDQHTRRLFFRVFRMLKIKQKDGSLREVLAWSRPFYSDGGRRFDPGRELSAFVLDEDRVLGLANTYRFSRVLPTRYNPNDPERNGLLYDRNGQPLVRFDAAKGKVTNKLPGGGALVGFDLRRRGVRDGLLRIFGRMMRGVEPLPDVHRELEDQLAQRQRGPWGYDITLTLDERIQKATFEIVRDQVERIDAKERDTLHHASAIVLGPRNEILAMVQMPDTGRLETMAQITALKKAQQKTPLSAPALDTLHRRTTLGSTIKLLTIIAAFQHKDDTLIKWKDGEWYIKAEGDERNSKDGRYIERGGKLASWHGQAIAPVRNYGRSWFGQVVPLRTLLVKSLNTGSAYLGLNLGRERYEDFFGQLNLDKRVDLLPGPMQPGGRWSAMMDRYYRDSASALPVVIGSIPKDEPWTPSLTARLPLSGLSDYSVFSLAAGVSIIARGGVYHPPTLVKSIRSRRDGTVERFAPEPTVKIIDPQDAQDIKSYMRDVIKIGTAGVYRRGLPEEVWGDTGGKTGTAETTRPVDPNAGYDLKNKPRTRDHKAFVGIWPTRSPQPYVVAVVFEYVSHIDTRVAVLTTQQIMESIRALHAEPENPTPTP